TQNISAPGTTLFWIANGNYQNLGPGNIGGNAEVNITAVSISTGDLLAQIQNFGASIGANAQVNVAASSLTVNGTLDSQINNSQSGTIGGNASINFAISGNVNVTTDAMFQIL